MADNSGREQEIRASDAEREQIARMLQTAASDGRLTLEELEERLEQLYGTKYQHELQVLVRDLPAESRNEPAVAKQGTGNRRFGGPLVVHLAVVAVMSVMLIGRWVVSDSPFFWPVFPMFWLWMSVFVHALIRNRHWRTRPV